MKLFANVSSIPTLFISIVCWHLLSKILFLILIIWFRPESEGPVISTERVFAGRLVIFISIGFFILTLLSYAPQILRRPFTRNAQWQFGIGFVFAVFILVHDSLIGVGISNPSYHIYGAFLQPFSETIPILYHAIPGLLLLASFGLPCFILIRFLAPLQ